MQCMSGSLGQNLQQNSVCPAPAITKAQLCWQMSCFIDAVAHLPGSSLAMLAHLLPKMLCAAMMAASSSGANGPFLTSGLSWLSHLQHRHKQALH